MYLWPVFPLFGSKFVDCDLIFPYLVPLEDENASMSRFHVVSSCHVPSARFLNTSFLCTYFYCTFFYCGSTNMRSQSIMPIKRFVVPDRVLNNAVCMTTSVASSWAANIFNFLMNYPKSGMLRNGLTNRSDLHSLRIQAKLQREQNPASLTWYCQVSCLSFSRFTPTTETLSSLYSLFSRHGQF